MAQVLQSGVSSNTGLVQPANYQLVNSTGGVASSSKFNEDYLQNKVSNLLQQSQVQGVNSTAPTNLAGANPYGVIRQPWIFSTFASLTAQTTVAQLATNNQGLPNNTIVWYANPKSVDWTMNQRGMEAKTKSGSVLHMWRDRLRRTDYDDPKITMTFQSGSIMPGYADASQANYLDGVPNVPLAQGLNNFYQFLALVDASKISNGKANLIHILYRSRIFPAMVLAGFFDPQSVVRFTDSADNPFQVNSWSASFTLYSSIPEYNNWQQLQNMFMQEFTNSDPFRRASQTTGAVAAMFNTAPPVGHASPNWNPNSLGIKL